MKRLVRRFLLAGLLLSVVLLIFSLQPSSKAVLLQPLQPQNAYATCSPVTVQWTNPINAAIYGGITCRRITASGDYDASCDSTEQATSGAFTFDYAGGFDYFDRTGVDTRYQILHVGNNTNIADAQIQVDHYGSVDVSVGGSTICTGCAQVDNPGHIAIQLSGNNLTFYNKHNDIYGAFATATITPNYPYLARVAIARYPNFVSNATLCGDSIATPVPTNTPTNTPTITLTPTRTNTPTNTPIPTITCAAGSEWCTSLSPNGAGPNELHGVMAIKENDIWAVGGYGITAQGGHSLFEHWDGNSWTTATPVPDIGTLNGVAGIASDDIWVAGDSGLRHWRGTSWVEEPSDDPNIGTPWYGVTALSSNYAWAVGSAIQRWDGTMWRTSLQSVGGTLKGVAAVYNAPVYSDSRLR